MLLRQGLRHGLLDGRVRRLCTLVPLLLKNNGAHHKAAETRELVFRRETTQQPPPHIQILGETSNRDAVQEEKIVWVVASLSRRLMAVLVDVVIVVGAMGEEPQPLPAHQICVVVRTWHYKILLPPIPSFLGLRTGC